MAPDNRDYRNCTISGFRAALVGRSWTSSTFYHQAGMGVEEDQGEVWVAEDLVVEGLMVEDLVDVVELECKAEGGVQLAMQEVIDLSMHAAIQVMRSTVPRTNMRMMKPAATIAAKETARKNMAEAVMVVDVSVVMKDMEAITSGSRSDRLEMGRLRWDMLMASKFLDPCET